MELPNSFSKSIPQVTCPAVSWSPNLRHPNAGYEEDAPNPNDPGLLSQVNDVLVAMSHYSYTTL